jgi:hypothetical protein
VIPLEESANVVSDGKSFISANLIDTVCLVSDLLAQLVENFSAESIETVLVWVGAGCGLFFAGDKGEKPKETLYIIPKLFPAADCSNPDQDSFNAFCTKIFNQLSKKITYQTDSIYQVRADEGFSIGDDICALLKRDHGIVNVGGEISKKAPEGLEIGFYYNSCGSTPWYDTSLRHPEGPICCRKGRYTPCKIAFAE